MRVALYARVSTEEQARHGISIKAQADALRSWAAANDHTIVGEYIEEGVSARKTPSKRPALQTLLHDIPEKKIDLIAFTKLDRWTRNVKGYYQVQETLDRYKVAWAAIQEDYETITSSGRFKVNIMLSVAENEADRTSERIKAVFEHKVNLGQPITSAHPLGYKIAGKTLVPDESAAAALEAFENYAENGNKMAVRNMLHGKYGIKLSNTAVSNLLQNTIYIGEYRGNAQFCEPIIPRDLFFRVQRDLGSRSTRSTPTRRVYLFSGLMVCKECGRHMGASHSRGRDYYRCCSGNQMFHDCPNGNYIRETAVESMALAKLSEMVSNQQATISTPAKAKPAVNKAAVNRKLDRLKELYIDGDISKDKYQQRRDELTALLNLQAPKPPRISEIAGSNFAAEYAAMDRAGKKKFWRSIIEKIEVDAAGTVDIIFMA